VTLALIAYLAAWVLGMLLAGFVLAIFGLAIACDKIEKRLGDD